MCVSPSPSPKTFPALITVDSGTNHYKTEQNPKPISDVCVNLVENSKKKKSKVMANEIIVMTANIYCNVSSMQV